jgi:type III restriction enzyme
MRFELKDYQRDVVDETLEEISDGFSKYLKRNALSAVGITAPTGAGKTVIAAAVIEELYFGADLRNPNPDLIVLWVTDDAELNEQSRSKIALASDRITNPMMLTIDSSLDQPSLTPGYVYFLNIQKLGEGAARHVRVGESRRHSLWETIGNTITDHGHNLIVIIDEAHRGSGDNAKPTILRTIIDGGEIQVKNSEGEVVRTVFNPPAPFVLGISATPEKFNTAMSTTKSSRSITPVAADLQKVRASGLIKTVISVDYSDDNQATDDTLLRVAVADLIASDKLWERRRIETEGRDAVTPLLVIQVPDKTSPARIAEIAQTLTETWSGFNGRDSIAHSFGEHADIVVDTVVGGVTVSRRVQYVPPSNISSETRIRAVIFKKALTTGWDCPRAEVMISLRNANDFTEIAQLIGRMVRNPLAENVDGADYVELNAVNLYLPNYNAAEVARVVKSFKADDNVGPELRLQPVDLHRNANIPDDVWAAAEAIPREIKPFRRYRNEIQHLTGLATTLDNEGFTSGGGGGFETEADALIVSTLEDVFERHSTELTVTEKDLLTVSFSRTRYGQNFDEELSETAREVAVSSVNLSGLEADALRLLPENAGTLYIGALISGGMTSAEAITRAHALAHQPDAATDLNTAATNRIKKWRSEQNGALGRLESDTKRATLELIWAPVSEPVTETMTLPDQLRVSTQKLSADEQTVTDLPLYAKHLFVNNDNMFPQKLNSWERDVLETELATTTLIAWYRNPVGGLSILYLDGEETRAFHPDFIFFHRAENGEVLIDIVDPHWHTAGDAPKKWAALTRYAQTHGTHFRQVVAVIKTDDDELLSLRVSGGAEDLSDIVANTSSGNGMLQLFRDRGGKY